MKVIPTTYKGVRFRSRLEARWAVFFDALRIDWDYEAEAFSLPGGVSYSPDFRLLSPIGLDSWFEVKPPGAVNELDLRKISGFTKALGGHEYLLLARGPPWACELFCCDEKGLSGLFSPPFYLSSRFAPLPIPTPEDADRAADEARGHRFWDPQQGRAT